MRATERGEMLQQDSWEFLSLNDIERLWTEVRTVPMRAGASGLRRLEPSAGG